MSRRVCKDGLAPSEQNNSGRKASLIRHIHPDPFQVDSDSEPEAVTINKNKINNFYFRTVKAKPAVIVLDSNSEDEGHITAGNNRNHKIASPTSSKLIRNEHSRRVAKHFPLSLETLPMDVDDLEDPTVADKHRFIQVLSSNKEAARICRHDATADNITRNSTQTSEDANGAAALSDEDAASTSTSVSFRMLDSPGRSTRNRRLVTNSPGPKLAARSSPLVQRSPRSRIAASPLEAGGNSKASRLQNNKRAAANSSSRIRRTRAIPCSFSARNGRRNTDSLEENIDSGTVVDGMTEYVVRRPPGAISSARSAALFTGQITEGLPLELRQHILFHVPENVDRLNLACTARGFLPCFLDNTLWCRLLKSEYDPISIPSDAANASSFVEYQAKVYESRSVISRSVTCFDARHFGGGSRGLYTIDFIPTLKDLQQGNSEIVLDYLTALIIESNANKVRNARGIHEVVGKNFDHIRRRLTNPDVLHRLDILDAVMSCPPERGFWSLSKIMSSHQPKSRVLVVQLCLTHFFLDPNINTSNCYYFGDIGGFPVAQIAAHIDHGRQPIFIGKYKPYANVRWILSVVRFMRYHLLESGELVQYYASLEPQLRPQAWMGRLQTGTRPLGTHWLGGCVWIHDDEFINFRMDPSNSHIIDASDGLHELSIFHDERAFSSKEWPQQFETLIGSDPFPPEDGPDILKVPRFDLLSFFGTSRDAHRPGHFYGRVHGLPPQQGIPGFQRVSFIKFCYKPNESSVEYVDREQVWSYEGCVLPGGHIMVGRWMFTHLDGTNLEPHERLSGPFIYWNVEDNRADHPILPWEALKHLKLLRSIGFI